MNGNENLDKDEPIVDVDDNDDTATPIIYDISSYGADYDVDGLVRRLKRNDILIPSFQRDYVWNLTEASKFIESLLLGLPVPGVFLAKDNENNRLLVIDGQQRLKSLLFFYEGIFNPKKDDIRNRVFRLKNVQKRFENKTYKELDEEDRIKLNDSIIHATIIKQESPQEDNTSIYHVFERLNTGGRKLTPQEIRSAIYPGKLNRLIVELNEYSSWRILFGEKNNRLKDQEMILRFLAMITIWDKYSKPLREFLNRFNQTYRNPTDAQLNYYRTLFKKTIDIILSTFGQDAFKPERVFNAAVFDVLMVGIAKRIDSVIDFSKIAANYNRIYEVKEYVDSISRATSDERVIAARHKLFDEFIEKYVS
ncbi:MAG: DUF262 domain-containing protein [Chloroflexota bacterium]